MPESVRHVVRQFNWLRAGAVFARGTGEGRVAWFDTAVTVAVAQQCGEQRVREWYQLNAGGMIPPTLITTSCGPDWHLTGT